MKILRSQLYDFSHFYLVELLGVKTTDGEENVFSAFGSDVVNLEELLLQIPSDCSVS
jgi:hypothetical protein